jgi:hypothetical protein
VCSLKSVLAYNDKTSLINEWSKIKMAAKLISSQNIFPAFKWFLWQPSCFFETSKNRSGFQITVDNETAKMDIENIQ